MKQAAGPCWGVFALIVLAACFTLQISGQDDPAQKGARVLRKASHGELTVQAEERTRWEEQYGVKFGKAVNQQDMLSRIRIGMQYRPTAWLTVSGMGQDARAPFYGAPAPGSLRDTMDLQEGWITASTENNLFNVSFGRRMLDYGETRVIGTPQWSNTSRTYDYSRVEYVSKKMILDGLMVSPVIVQPDKFNTPELGNRIWGMYDVFPQVWRGGSVDVYALRHSQNKIGGWTSAGTLGTNTYGMRFYGPLPSHFTYSLEGIGQNGHLGLSNQRAYAWFAGVVRPVTVFAMPLSLSLEYKGASGSRYGASHSATYDQVSPANHDKFGHMDQFGWRNLKTLKSLETLKLTKHATFNVMYTDEYLFSASDALYASNGTQIAISTKGAYGKRVGQELDAFMTYTAGHHTFYAGFGHFFKGQFVEQATPGINPRYFYIAQQYVIK
ncbi:MAG TPA: alginate export family protein [Terracidiphilus sp.]|nr:alginate export family protein [Terracidiphilus sp.]